jgi:hypothetical protein
MFPTIINMNLKLGVKDNRLLRTTNNISEKDKRIFVDQGCQVVRLCCLFGFYYCSCYVKEEDVNILLSFYKY